MPEMSVFKLRFNQGLLNCTHCRKNLRPDTYNGRAYTCRQCVRGQIYCHGCIRRHHCLAADTHSTCGFLNDIISQMKLKCNFCDSREKYIPYCQFMEHQREFHKYSTPPARWKCMLKTSLLLCSECGVPPRPPVFSHWSRNLLICSACYRADIGTYHCTELEYLLQGITVRCVACKRYLPFFTLGSHQVGDCPFKRKLQNIAPGLSARKKFCDEETKRPMASNNSIHGKNKRKAPFEVGKMDKHIVHGDEVANDDDSYSCDDNHGMSEDVFSSEDDSIDKMDEGEEDETPTKLETVKRVAENAFKTPSCDKKAKITTPNGQKTDEYESTAGNRTIIGKTKGNAPSKVRKIDNHIVDSDVVESDDDSSADIHPETRKAG